jgi:hypothetical protein
LLNLAGWRGIMENNIIMSEHKYVVPINSKTKYFALYQVLISKITVISKHKRIAISTTLLPNHNVLLAFITDVKTNKHMPLTVTVEPNIIKVPHQRKRPRTRYLFRELHARSYLVVFEKQQRQQADQKEAQCN